MFLGLSTAEPPILNNPPSFPPPPPSPSCLSSSLNSHSLNPPPYPHLPLYLLLPIFLISLLTLVLSPTLLPVLSHLFSLFGFITPHFLSSIFHTPGSIIEPLISNIPSVLTSTFRNLSHFYNIFIQRMTSLSTRFKSDLLGKFTLIHNPFLQNGSFPFNTPAIKPQKRRLRRHSFLLSHRRQSSSNTSLNIKHISTSTPHNTPRIPFQLVNSTPPGLT